MKKIPKQTADLAFNNFKKFISEKSGIKTKLQNNDEIIKEFFTNIGINKQSSLFKLKAENLPFLNCEEIKNIVKELEETEFYKDKTYKEKTAETQEKKQFDEIKKNFSDLYDILTKKESGCGYELLIDLKLRACPYCNLNYIDAVITEDDRNSTKKTINSNNKVLRHHFDHYFPKSKFPFLGISFYNLIPSCYECNSALKGDDTDRIPLNPYAQDFDSMAKFYIQPANIEHPMSFSKETDFEIKLDYKVDIVKQHCELFALQERYKYRKDYVLELLTKKKIYTDEFKEEIYRQLLNIPNMQIDVNLIILGNYVNSEQINLRPLAKLTKDLFEN